MTEETTFVGTSVAKTGARVATRTETLGLGRIITEEKARDFLDGLGQTITAVLHNHLTTRTVSRMTRERTFVTTGVGTWFLTREFTLATMDRRRRRHQMTIERTLMIGT